jgi:hypothetical protein
MKKIFNNANELYNDSNIPTKIDEICCSFDVYICAGGISRVVCRRF